MTVELDLSSIRTDGGTQPRAILDLEAAEDYAEAIRDGARLPPVIVFYDGSDHWLADGFHRHAAHRLLELHTIEAEVRQGTRRNAVLYSCGANASHGMRRTNADKRRAVRTLLEDPEWVLWPQTRIAEVCHVSERHVRNMVAMLQPQARAENRTRVVSRDGKEYELDTTNLVRRQTEPRPARDVVADAVRKHRAEDRDENMATGEARRLLERLLELFATPGLPDPQTAAESLPGAFVSEAIARQLERGIDYVTDFTDHFTDRLQRETADEP